MKRSLKLLSLLLALCTVLLSFAACSPASKKPAVRYGDYTITHAMFQYLCCLEKTGFLYEAYGVTEDQISSGELEDNAQIWVATDAQGVTVADTLKMTVLERVQMYLYLCQYAKDNGQALNSEQIKTVEAEFDTLVRNNFTDKKTFNRYMESYGIDYDQMLQYKILESQAYLCEEMLFGEGGAYQISRESAKKYYEDKYMTLDCIFINTKNKTLANGKTISLPAAEKEEKLALADDLARRLEEGEDFATLCLEYSDQDVSESLAKNGYTFEKGSFFNSEVETRAYDAAVGSLQRLDTEEGVYLFRRKNLNNAVFDEKKDAIIALLENAKKASLLAEVIESFKMDEKFIEGLDVAELNHVV